MTHTTPLNSLSRSPLFKPATCIAIMAMLLSAGTAAMAADKQDWNKALEAPQTAAKAAIVKPIDDKAIMSETISAPQTPDISQTHTKTQSETANPDMSNGPIELPEVKAEMPPVTGNSLERPHIICPAGTTAQSNGTCMITGDYKY